MCGPVLALCRITTSLTRRDIVFRLCVREWSVGKKQQRVLDAGSGCAKSRKQWWNAVNLMTFAPRESNYWTGPQEEQPVNLFGDASCLTPLSSWGVTMTNCPECLRVVFKRESDHVWIVPLFIKFCIIYYRTYAPNGPLTLLVCFKWGSYFVSSLPYRRRSYQRPQGQSLWDNKDNDTINEVGGLLVRRTYVR